MALAGYRGLGSENGQNVLAALNGPDRRGAALKRIEVDVVAAHVLCACHYQTSGSESSRDIASACSGAICHSIRWPSLAVNITVILEDVRAISTWCSASSPRPSRPAIPTLAGTVALTQVAARRRRLNANGFSGGASGGAR